MTYISPIQSYLAKTLHGALIQAYGDLHDMDLIDLVNPEKPESSEVNTVLRETLGINFDELAFYALNSICELMADDRVADSHISNLASALWMSLGDPTTGGTKPPEIYTDAAQTVYIMLLVILNPTVSPSSL